MVFSAKMEALALERDSSTAIISAPWGTTDGSHFLLSPLELWRGGCLHLKWTDSKKRENENDVSVTCHRARLCLLKKNNGKGRFRAWGTDGWGASSRFFLVLSVEAV